MKMRVLICPDSFKGTLTATQAARAINDGIMKAMPKAKTALIPMADGGAGTIDALQSAGFGRLVINTVKGPLGRPVRAKYIIKGRTAVIEMAQASGLLLVMEKKRNPLLTTTFGTGQLIKHALDSGCNQIVVCVGGSATNDVGMGMAQALGFRFLDSDGNAVSFRKKQGYSGGSLRYVSSVDASCADSRIKSAKLVLASDVENPLTGRNGAARVYGAQKGMDKKTAIALDKETARFSRVVLSSLRKKKRLDMMKGAGAAGGLGFGLMAFLNARTESGVEIISKAVGLDKEIKRADLVITGEGMIDSQTVHGKTIHGILRSAVKHNRPVVAIGGCLGRGWKMLKKCGICGVWDASHGKKKGMSCLRKNAYILLKDCSEEMSKKSITENRGVVR